MSDVSCFHNLKTGGIERQLAPGVSARVFPGVHAMLSVVTLEPGAVSPVHAHPNEQWGVCLEGEWVRVQDGVEHHVKAGDFWQTPPNVPHGGRALGARWARAGRALRRARHLRAAARGIPPAGRGAGRGDARALTRAVCSAGARGAHGGASTRGPDTSGPRSAPRVPFLAGDTIRA